MLQLAEEKISNVKTVKAFSKEAKECESYGQRIEKVLQLAYKESLAVGSFYATVNLHNVHEHDQPIKFPLLGLLVNGLYNHHTSQMLQVDD